MIYSPCNESPVCAMPQSANCKHNKNVPQVVKPRTSTAPQRNIDVIGEPAHERYVPSTPEVLNVFRKIRIFEVLT